GKARAAAPGGLAVAAGAWAGGSRKLPAASCWRSRASICCRSAASSPHASRRHASRSAGLFRSAAARKISLMRWKSAGMVSPPAQVSTYPSVFDRLVVSPEPEKDGSGRFVAGQFLQQPGAGERPVPVRGGARHPQGLGGLFDGKAG